MVNLQSLGLEFENECLRGAKSSLDYAVKVPDTRSLSGLINRVVNWIRNTHVVAKLYRMQFGYLPKPNNFIAIKSPYDLICCQKGRAIAIECKQTKAMSLSFNNVKPHQIKELKRISDAKGIGVFCVNFNNRERIKARKINETYIVDINLFLMFQVMAIKDNRKSIPIENFRRYATKLNRIKKKGKFEVDFTPIINATKTLY